MSWWNILNPSGGWRYHRRAAKYQDLWQSYVANTNLWLKKWQPQKSQLLLLGPSAGYSLTVDFLQQFERIDAIDVDPLAPFFFRRRFPELNVHWHQQNFFTLFPQRLHLNGLKELQQSFPTHAWLFCNFLGQLPLLVRNFHQHFDIWQETLLNTLKQVEWASYHDIWSAEETTESHGARDPINCERSSFDFSQSARYWLDGKSASVNDHYTFELFKGINHAQHWGWQISPTQFHCVEGVRP